MKTNHNLNVISLKACSTLGNAAPLWWCCSMQLHKPVWWLPWRVGHTAIWLQGSVSVWHHTTYHKLSCDTPANSSLPCSISTGTINANQKLLLSYRSPLWTLVSCAGISDLLREKLLVLNTHRLKLKWLDSSCICIFCSLWFIFLNSFTSPYNQCLHILS